MSAPRGRQPAPRPVRAVVDTNLWISGLLSRSGAPAQLRTAYLQRRFTVVISPPVIAELEEVAARPELRRYGLLPVAAGELLGFLRRWAHPVQITGELQLCRDPKDDMFIETAISGKADVLVSGDQDLTRLGKAAVEYLAAKGVRVLSVHEFLQALDAEG